ncbi:MAG: TRAP transporter large permease [Hoeflea sp.]|uniref:TRAP transporter large permease n=1 Tax=Hoeflea sp. TaxID=1940281 RepID=UPI0032996B2A|tara:strand:+ start:3572 stop:4852 length:1281 start_codon:yes stop_codon:yes gene_type:complete
MILLLALFALALIATPIAFAMGAASVLQLAVIGDYLQLQWIPRRMMDGLASYPLLAVPFFILAAELMNTAGITARIFTFSTAMVGHIRGGLGHVNVLSSVLFSGMSGSAIADAAGLGKIQIPEMTRNGYPAPFSAAITAASATIGPIVPPSIPLVIYGVVAEESVVRLLIAGFVPGVLIALLLSFAVYVQAVRHDYPIAPRTTRDERVSASRKAILPIAMPVILIGGILSGFFTPTEAALVAVVYALVLITLIYREAGAGDVWSAFRTSSLEASKVLLIVGLAYPVSLVLTTMELPQQLVKLFLSISDSSMVFMLATCVLLLIIGCFLESVSAMIIVVPLLLAPAQAFGVDPIHFGVVVVLNLMIGLVTPPFGLSMFIACEISGVRQGAFIKAMAPYYLALLSGLLLVAFVPELSTGLPDLVFGAR